MRHNVQHHNTREQRRKARQETLQRKAARRAKLTMIGAL